MKKILAYVILIGFLIGILIIPSLYTNWFWSIFLLGTMFSIVVLVWALKQLND